MTVTVCEKHYIIFWTSSNFVVCGLGNLIVSQLVALSPPWETVKSVQTSSLLAAMKIYDRGLMNLDSEELGDELPLELVY